MLVLSAVFLISFAPAPDRTDIPPTGFPPQVVYITVRENGELMWEVTIHEPVAFTAVVEKFINGKRELVPEQVQTFLTKTRYETIDLNAISVYELGGREVSKEEFVKRLKRGATVAVSSNHKPVDPGYLKLFKEGTLVVVTKPPQPQPNPK